MQIEIIFTLLCFYALEEINIDTDRLTDRYRELKENLTRLINRPKTRGYRDNIRSIAEEFKRIYHQRYDNDQIITFTQNIMHKNIDILRKIDGVNTCTMKYDNIICEVEGYQQVELIKKSIDYNGSFEIRVIDYVDR